MTYKPFIVGAEVSPMMSGGEVSISYSYRALYLSFFYVAQTVFIEYWSFVRCI